MKAGVDIHWTAVTRTFSISRPINLIKASPRYVSDKLLAEERKKKNNNKNNKKRSEHNMSWLCYILLSIWGHVKEIWPFLYWWRHCLWLHFFFYIILNLFHVYVNLMKRLNVLWLQILDTMVSPIKKFGWMVSVKIFISK